ncbi:hypothetical protein [Pontibacillus sp. HMF3514]|uniref:hypothetical protein n=1 Tax=Pontibacillus sp. HMF3514 TaxID=2692425 RepID=UPI0013203715|nr:hypothetical protein [Pontibacillus sp. HMF3514]QHE51646.1 hypothetical protein GS400_06160 [Pontibacillus sp. HMF3514]
MSYDAMYQRCCRLQGRVVRLRCHGRVHVGEVTRVTRSHVWIRPIGGPRGLGYGFFGFRGFGVPFALGAITGIALASVFFW